MGVNTLQLLQISLVYLLFFAVLIIMAIPLGRYMTKVMNGEKVFLTRVLSPCEHRIYKILRVGDKTETTAKKYILDVLLFSFLGFIFVFLLQLCQGFLPLNPQNLGAPSVSLAFNTALSFVTNTNWQAYSGETTLSYFTQSVGLTVQNFVSAGVGIAVMFAVIRGFIRKKENTIGSFWHDITRSILYILLPLSLILSVLLMSQGVVQSLLPSETIHTLESSADQVIPLGPAASQIAIKQLGTNGGGFFGANSAFPLENPTAISNLLETLAILLIPCALCFSFGKAVKDSKQGRTIFITMTVLFVAVLSIVTLCEHTGINHMEGKEVVNGVTSSALWGTATTAASNGSVNASLDSFSSIGGMMLMFLMQLGEIVFGGVGSGLYGMLAFVMLTVFIAGLMVGRTPEYLGKKIEPFDMKMICVVVLVPPICTLLATAIAVMMPSASFWLTNTGAHGFSEILYAFTSMGNNNGSAFAGFMANTTFTNIVGGFLMLVVRYVPLVAVLLMAGNLGKKKLISAGEGTLKTTGVTFTTLLIIIIIIIGALTFLPVLALGPIADFVTH